METHPDGITLGELAQRLGGILAGDGAVRVRRVATLEQAGPDALAWLGSAEYLPQFAATRAAGVLVSTAIETPPGPAIIRVPDADAALVEVLALLAPPVPNVPVGVHPTALVHPTAMVAGAAVGPFVIVGPRATVGPATQLHAHVTIGDDVRIGRECVLWPGVVIRERVTLGERVIIHPNTTIGADGFGYLQRDGRHVKIPQVGTVEIGDDVEIGAGCCIDRARSGATRIGRGAKIDNLVQIGHNVEVGEDCIIVSQCGISGSSTLGRGVMLGGQVGVADHVRIGDRARLIAQAGVAADLAAEQTYGGTPAIPQRQYWRTVAAQQRLADLLAEVRELKKRVARIESATHDQPRS